jgi:hypothetical protein
MDMMLDHKRSSTFQCHTCDYKLAALRSCSTEKPSAKNHVNGKVYRRCPKALYMEAGEERALVELYMDCRESKTLPAQGNILQQTAFTKEVFDFLDGLVAVFREDQQKKHQEDMKRLQSKNGK